MNKQFLLIGGVVLVLAVGAYFLLMRPQTQPTTQTQPTPTQVETSTPESTGSSDAAGEVVELTVESKGMRFTPNQLKVKSGDTVRITYKNTQGQHDFTLDEFDVKTSLLNAGEEETVEFVADKAGEYEFYCSVPGHRQAGMKGTLTVE